MKFITVVLGLVSLGHVVSAVVPVTTGTFKPTAPGQCDINMKSFGWVDTGVDMKKSSYIKVNDLTYFDSFDGNYLYRGFDLVTLDMNTCKASNFGHFDTAATATEADLLAKYIYGIPDGTHILGVTSDDGNAQLNDAGKAALKSIGVDPTRLGYRDKMIFHVIKGRPEKAVVITKKAAEENLFYEEKAAPCIVCQNGGYLKMNSAGTGFECQCLKIYTGPYCEKFSEAGCVEHFTATEKTTPAKKRQLL
jgi:hypothetical protein